MISILGISAFIMIVPVLIQDGKVIAAAQEERFSEKMIELSISFN